MLMRRFLHPFLRRQVKLPLTCEFGRINKLQSSFSSHADALTHNSIHSIDQSSFQEGGNKIELAEDDDFDLYKHIRGLIQSEVTSEKTGHVHRTDFLEITGAQKKSPLIITKSDLAEDDDLDQYKHLLSLNLSDMSWIPKFVEDYGDFLVQRNETVVKDLIPIIPQFVVICPKHEKQFLYRMKSFFKVGTIYENKEENDKTNGFVVPLNHTEPIYYKVLAITAFTKLIIPFFKANPLQRKKYEFMKFRIIVSLISKREHHTPQGLEKLRRVQQDDFQLDATLQHELDN